MRLTIDKVGFLGHSAHEFFFSVPNTFCTLTQQSNGFTAMWWYQHFLMKDAWDEIFLDEFLALELKETQPLDPCEYPPEPPPFWAYIPAGSGVLTDTHTVQHPNCCDVCACYQESADSWTGRSNGAQMWLLDNYWAESCFWYAFTYVLRN